MIRTISVAIMVKIKAPPKYMSHFTHSGLTGGEGGGGGGDSGNTGDDDSGAGDGSNCTGGDFVVKTLVMLQAPEIPELVLLTFQQ